ncbi:hypothetical protein QVD17_30043 [Tagetes erecta]|uniref:VOC domain-containing protein n=1 Tax=Tagetes erecta TaxID=13708 RepID=A0AAD8K224_TARER|nr:hypothetical protein QVD17_30043 [Tagetes erecta]
MKEIGVNPLFLKSLNHISLQCRSVEESVDFYVKILGFVQIKRPGNFYFDGAWLFGYGIGIHLIQFQDTNNVTKKNEINTKDNHISFQCDSIGVVEKKLKEMVISYKKQRVDEGEIYIDQLFFHDLDGFMIEICNCDVLPVIPIARDMVRSCLRFHVPGVEAAVTSTKVCSELRDHLNRKMYGRKASQLLKEFMSSEPGQITAFNNDLFNQVTEECNGHFLHLQALLRKMQEEGSSNQTSKNADHFGALIHHLSVVRNKRCLLAYVYNRAEIIHNLAWTTIRHDILPDEIVKKLSNSEYDYLKNHSAALKSYMSDSIDLDLAVDMVPPKDPYIKVRVLEDIGNEIVLSDQVANLPMHAILFLKRIDAEEYISQGKMEELTS